MKTLQEHRMEIEKLIREGLYIEPEHVTQRGMRTWKRRVKRRGFKKEIFADPQFYIDRFIPALEKACIKHEGITRGLDRVVLDLDRMTLEASFMEPQMDDVGYMIGDAIFTIKLTLPITIGDLNADIPIKIKTPRARSDYYPPDDEYAWEVYVGPFIKDLKMALQKSKLL